MLRLDHFLAHRGDRTGLRGVLARIGPSMERTPVRRTIQAAAFVLFLVLVFWVSWPYDARPLQGAAGWPSHYADDLAAKEVLPVESFLLIDPLVALSAALAARAWMLSLASAAAILAICLLVPRGFCGYLCPLGTLIDLFDGTIGRRIVRFRLAGIGRWQHLRYLILVGSLAAAAAGVMLAGMVAAIPVLTRGMSFAVDPLVHAASHGWHAVPPPNWGNLVSLLLFAGVLGLGLLRPRFWCRHVCPSGAVFSLANRLRLTERKVTTACIGCNQCVRACPFDAINPDWTTRTDACTMCQTCGGACPTTAISFVGRRAVVEAKPVQADAAQPQVTRRSLLAAGLSGAVAALGVRATAAGPDAPPLLRPPGSLPEAQFLAQCIRCEACLKVCPNDVLRPLGFERGLDGLWTPVLTPAWAGCEPSCNACGQSCPTGAIRSLPLEEKRHARIGLAVVDEGSCLPWAGREACQLCADECRAAGYDAIEFRHVHSEFAEDGTPVEGSGFVAPVVDALACVGCGLCQTRCVAINVKGRGAIPGTAIAVLAGGDREDRFAVGSYRERHQERVDAVRRRDEEQQRAAERTLGDFYR